MRRSIPYLLILLLFAVSRLLYETVSPGVGTIRFDHPIERAISALWGDHLDVTTMDRGMPILDETLLRNDLWRSVWYLHSQPPLFNIFVAAMLRLPGSLAVNYQVVNWLMALALFLMTFHLMRRLGATTAPSLAWTFAFMLNPNTLWMESAIYYGLVIAFLMAFAAWSLDHAFEQKPIAWLTGAGFAILALPLLRAFFTLPWLLVIALFFVLARSGGPLEGTSRRAVITVALVPVLVLLGFQIKQSLMFGQFAGSSWLGCNLATMTASMSSDKGEAVADGEISELALVYRNDPPETYLKYFEIEPTGIPVLDQTRKSSGEPNFNHLVYIPACRQYLSDTLWLILHHPIKYMLNVVNSIYIFSGYQIGLYFDHPSLFFGRWSALEIAAPLIGFPLFVIALGSGLLRLRRTSRSQREWWTISFMLLNIVYVLLVSVLIEKSEGPLYRYQIDAFLYILLALATSTWLSRRSNATARNGKP